MAQFQRYQYTPPPRTAEQQAFDDDFEAIQGKLDRIISDEVNRRVVTILADIEAGLAEIQRRAKKLADDHGMTEGQQHKQWVIDQLLQTILGEVEYAVWLRRHDYEAAQAGTARWDFGIAP